MSRQLESYGINILKMHAAWLTVNGYKLQDVDSHNIHDIK